MNLFLSRFINCYQWINRRIPMIAIKKRSRLAFFFLLLIFITGILLGALTGSTADRRFEDYTEQFAREQLSQNTLNLHYTLADPSASGIRDYQVSLGEVTTNPDAFFVTLENEREKLLSFRYESLSDDNQLTYDILKLYFDTELSDDNQYYLMEVLSPSLGIQAQLPLLLAEYTFRTKQDVQDYYCLLKNVPSYFDSIIAFETEKSKRGYFMSDKTADRVIDQCRSFLSSSDNYMHTVFKEKIAQAAFFTDEEKASCIELHRKLMEQCVTPAYQSLITALTRLKGSGQNQNGLYYLGGGRAYYTYLIRSSCGIYDSIEELQTRLGQQLNDDYQKIRTLISQKPSLATALLSDSSAGDLSPEQILTSLQQNMQKDFPGTEPVSYEIKYVHEGLKEHLSPAFYLTPPIDTGSPNLIYLNPDASLHGIELYTTLSHEGFPGHLYQTQYFMRENASLIRHLLNMPGYVEGWATYIESYAYEYGSSDPDLGRLLWLGRSMNLCIYSLLDIGIHYHGWTLEKVTDFLADLGISDGNTCREIFQCIIEDPANYLKYYGGCLQFMDLREQAAAMDDFHLVDFHRNILETGPCQFPVLEEQVLH